MKKGQTKNSVAIVLILVVVSVGIFIIVDININKSSSITGNIINILKNCREVEVPYTIVEEYSYYPEAKVVEGYQEGKIELFGKGIYREGIVSLKNIDNDAGWFNVNFFWETLKDKHKDTIRHYINPDETVEFVSIYNTDLGEDTQFKYTYQSEPILKTRTITKYRTETVCE